MRNSVKALGVLVVNLAVIAGAGSAFADCHGNGANSGDETTNVGNGSSSQVIKWNLSDRKVRVKAVTGSGMNTDNCHDAAFDWITADEHYDGRIARNCQPGTMLESDPNGDGWWSEPAGWGGRDVNGIQKAGGFIYDEPGENYTTSQYVPQSMVGCPFHAVPFSSQNPPKGVQFIWRTGSGVVWTWDGGDPTSPNS